MKKLPFSSGIVYHIALFPIAFLIVLATSKGICPLLYVSLYLEKDPTAGTIVSDGVEYSEFVSDDEVKIAIGEGTSTPTISLYSAKVDADGNHKIASNIF